MRPSHDEVVEAAPSLVCGGPQIDNALKKIGKQGTFVQGMRITDEETMEVVEWLWAA